MIVSFATDKIGNVEEVGMATATLREVCEWGRWTGWAAPFRFWASHVRPGRALELGARRGGLSLWLALRGCDVVCSDLWGSERARPLHERHGVAAAYEDIDVTSIPYENAFDIVAFKSLLGALETLERQEVAIEQMHR